MFSFLNPYMLWIKLAGVAILMGGAAYGGYRFELGRYEELVAADARAMTAAVEKARGQERAIAKGNQEDAIAQAYFKGKMDAQTVNLVLGVPANVTISQDVSALSADRAGCVTYGFVRVLIAGERGEPAESFSIPGGESVDSCTALKPSVLAAAVAQDLSAGTSNGVQLDSLIAAVKRNDAIITGAANIGGAIKAHALNDLEDSAGGKVVLKSVPGDVTQPQPVGASDGQAGPPGQREANDGVKPQIIDAPGAEKRGWEPVDARQFLAAADRPNVQDGEAGRAQLKGSLGDIGINLHVMPPDL